MALDYNAIVLNDAAGASSDSNYSNQITDLTQRFATRFANYVGRAPSSGEVETFIHQYVNPNRSSLGNSNDPHNQMEGQYLNDFINSSYQNSAKDFAAQQLEAQKGQANDLANLFRTQGNQAINDTEQNLMDYQSKLFEKLRPNLMTSLQSQGLLDTGGLNQALAGAQNDFANNAANWASGAKLNVENGANNIAFSGAAAPYNYQQSSILNTVPYLQQQGQNASNQNYNTFLTNLNYQNQLGLMAQQNKYMQDNQPSFLRTMGQSAASSLGNSLGQWASPNPGGSAGGSQSGPMAMKALFA